MRYNKLVRDKVPEIMRAKGIPSTTHTASADEYWAKLKEKLKEEVQEFLLADSEEEFADIMEVVEAMLESGKLGKVDVMRKKDLKKKERGSFSKRVILDETG